KSLDSGGADLIEIGLPFSDPVADGPTIQESSTQALKNGMTLKKLFEQLKDLRQHVSVPVLLMGYINPVLQFGFEAFCAQCQAIGIDGLILPDLPMYEYEEHYKDVLEKYGLYNVFLITPQTSDERIRKIDGLSKGFIYMVSSASTTGAKTGISPEQIDYFNRIKSLNLNNKRLIGFGISDNQSFNKACEFSDGAIIGSAFIKLLGEDSSDESIKSYIKQVKSSVS
ncbi:MAG: tryptophan synthase subunit alpha, partial [Marinoscillum sp.]